jgi:hypothetical protein
MSKKEKKLLLAGLYTLCTQFFSTYISNVQLGETWLEVSSCSDIRVPSKPRLEDQDSVPSFLQDAQVRASVSHVPSSLLEACTTSWTSEHEKY